jgi:hypothetical protein
MLKRKVLRRKMCMENVKKFFRGKSWGFYVSLAGAILLLVTAIIYSVTFGMSEHINLNFEVWVLVVALLGVAGFAALSVFEVTSPYAAAALFAGGFVAFLLFISTSYMYLSAVFFEVTSVASFFAAFEIMDFGFAFTATAMIAVWVLSTIGIFTSAKKTVAKHTEEENNEQKITA